MATTYNPELTTAKDKVRFKIRDRGEPWHFQDEEIVATLQGSDEAAIVRCAIELLESEETGSSVSEMIRQGSFSQSRTVVGGRQFLINRLREELALLNAPSGGGTGAPMVEIEFPQPERFPGERWI